MTATIGYASLLPALALAAGGIVAPPLGARAGRPALFASARAAIAGQFALVTVASLTLIYALVTADFSIKYVALNTTRHTGLLPRHRPVGRPRGLAAGASDKTLLVGAH